jgi:Ankyrin repeats (3 copies)
VRLLLKYGADPNVSSFDIILKELPLLSSRDILERPERNSADGILILYPLLGEHDYCRSALEAAAEIENLEIIDLLLEAGADINRISASYGGRTPMQRAAGDGNDQVIEHLLKHGASILSQPAPVCGASPLYCFVKSRLHKYVSSPL